MHTGDNYVGLAFWVHAGAALVIMATLLSELDLGSSTLTKQYTVSLFDMHYVRTLAPQSRVFLVTDLCSFAHRAFRSCPRCGACRR